jgi:hypothetical protein
MLAEMRLVDPAAPLGEQPVQSSLDDDDNDENEENYVLTHCLPDGRQLAVHICMAVMDGDLATLKPLVDPLSEEQLDDLFCITSAQVMKSLPSWT